MNLSKTCSRFVLAVISVVCLLQQPVYADEPPIHPRNATWNSYTHSKQFVPDAYGHGSICSTCQPPQNRHWIAGWKGTPYTDKVLGCENCRSRHASSMPFGAVGCSCEANSSRGIPASIHWPRPFSNFWEDQFPGSCCQHLQHRSGMGTRKSCGHFFDHLDVLSDIKLLESPRIDSGYYGKECDPYGKLGLSEYPAWNTAPESTTPPARSPVPQQSPNNNIAPEALDGQFSQDFHFQYQRLNSVLDDKPSVQRMSYRQEIPANQSSQLPRKTDTFYRHPMRTNGQTPRPFGMK